MVPDRYTKVRKRDALFPISSGKNYVDPQPVLVAHVGEL